MHSQTTTLNRGAFVPPIGGFPPIFRKLGKKLIGEEKNSRHGHQNIGGRVSAAGIAVLSKDFKKSS